MIETAIIVHYRSVDGCAIEETFHSLSDARRFAHHWIGEHPEVGSGYAVSGDGVGTIRAWGVSLAALFPAPASMEHSP
jgi:hypothetical protein